MSAFCLWQALRLAAVEAAKVAAEAQKATARAQALKEARESEAAQAAAKAEAARVADESEQRALVDKQVRARHENRFSLQISMISTARYGTAVPYRKLICCDNRSGLLLSSRARQQVRTAAV